MTSQDMLRVHLSKAGRTKIRYPARLLADDGTRVTVRAPWAGDGVRDFGFVRFEPGDVFTEHFWRDRWYAVKEVRTADGSAVLRLDEDEFAASGLTGRDPAAAAEAVRALDELELVARVKGLATLLD